MQYLLHILHSSMPTFTLKKHTIMALFLSSLALSACAVTNPHYISLEEKVGQMILVGFQGTGEEHTPEINDLLLEIKQGHVGGVILFTISPVNKRSRNIINEEQVHNLINMLQKNAPTPLFISVDQEGGRVRRFLPSHNAPNTPSAQEMGKLEPEVVYQHARQLGEYLKRVGVNLNFAPVVDVNYNPKSPAIGALGRSFANSPEHVIQYAQSFSKGLADSGILFSYKHFPGHGSSTQDSHFGLTDITSTWREQELKPYKALLTEDMAGMVMIGHMMHKNLDPNLPASLSPAVITGLLREQLRWDGVVVTDDLQMQAIVSHYSMREAIIYAIEAGVDIILIGNNLDYDPFSAKKLHAYLMYLVQEGRITEDRINESYVRIMRLKSKL